LDAGRVCDETVLMTADREAARADIETYQRTEAWAQRYRWRQHTVRAYLHFAEFPRRPFDTRVPPADVN
jgi:hypothetical protein